MIGWHAASLPPPPPLPVRGSHAGLQAGGPAHSQPWAPGGHRSRANEAPRYLVLAAPPRSRQARPGTRRRNCNRQTTKPRVEAG